ncbi:MAG: S8 family peptidase [Oculatellaceae cyanobacterium bins.114]|nr:S8 family peptidase [Oculatellaceae cyanobacterium bins.114]
MSVTHMGFSNHRVGTTGEPLGRGTASQFATRLLQSSNLELFITKGFKPFAENHTNAIAQNSFAPLGRSERPDLSRRSKARVPVPISRGAIAQRQRIRGSLSRTDGSNTQRDGSYADDFVVRGTRVGQRVEVTLTASRFDTYLQLINLRTGRELLYGDDVSESNTNSRLVFTVQRGGRYVVRVTSFRRAATGGYVLKSQTVDQSASHFNFYSGYGLVNAAATTAGALEQLPFPDVPNLGGSDQGLDLVNAPEVWAQGFTGQGITVAVLDDGVDYNHPDLVSNIWSNPNEIAGNEIDDDGNGFIDDVRGWDFANHDNDPSPVAQDGHGTHVAGTIAASRNGFGITGVAYNARIMPVRVDGDFNSLSQFDGAIAAGIHYAVQNGARVLSMSLGNNPNSPPLPLTEAALRVAEQAGVIAVSASGNERQSYGAVRPIEPASYAAQDLGIAVGSLDFNRVLDRDSNPAGAQRLDFVVAPGVEILSTVLNGTYDTKTGTSMATPHVSGVVALMLSANPNLTPAQVEDLLMTTANPNGIRFI